LAKSDLNKSRLLNTVEFKNRLNLGNIAEVGSDTGCEYFRPVKTFFNLNPTAAFILSA
jgi:hypothetical protein